MSPFTTAALFLAAVASAVREIAVTTRTLTGGTADMSTKSRDLDAAQEQLTWATDELQKLERHPNRAADDPDMILLRATLRTQIAAVHVAIAAQR